MCRGGLPKAALIGFSIAVSDIMLDSGSKDDAKGSVAPGIQVWIRGREGWLMGRA